MSITPLSAARSARCIHAVGSRRASTADREQGHPGCCSREEKGSNRFKVLVI